MRLTAGFRKRVADYRPPAPTTITATDSAVSAGFFGYFDTVTSAGRRNWEPQSGVLHLAIKGTDATMVCTGTTPFKVSVDGGAFSAPTASGGVIALFSGLSDVVHTVQVAPNNTFPSGNNTPSTGALISATGVTPSIAASSVVTWHTKDPSFPGVETHAESSTMGGNYVPTHKRPTATANWNISSGSVHFRAKATDIYVHTASPEIWYCVDAGAWTKVALTAISTGAGPQQVWQKLPITGSLSTYQELIVSDSPTVSNQRGVMGVMLTGTGAALAAPAASKTIVALFGASQVQGVGATMGSADIHRDQALISNLAAQQHGWAGKTIADANTGWATFVANIPAAKRQTILLSIGVNSINDASFQPDYSTLIANCLAAGFTKVVCRGLVQAGVDNSGKNTKISAAVTAAADARVVYADVSTWTASTTGTAGTIHMPDGSHPNDAGYQTMADWTLRDHSALLP